MTEKYYEYRCEKCGTEFGLPEYIEYPHVQCLMVNCDGKARERNNEFYG